MVTSWSNTLSSETDPSLVHTCGDSGHWPDALSLLLVMHNGLWDQELLAEVRMAYPDYASEWAQVELPQAAPDGDLPRAAPTTA